MRQRCERIEGEEEEVLDDDRRVREGGRREGGRLFNACPCQIHVKE